LAVIARVHPPPLSLSLTHTHVNGLKNYTCHTHSLSLTNTQGALPHFHTHTQLVYNAAPQCEKLEEWESGREGRKEGGRKRERDREKETERKRERVRDR
jgi:hypothetical protein